MSDKDRWFESVTKRKGKGEKVKIVASSQVTEDTDITPYDLWMHAVRVSNCTTSVHILPEERKAWHLEGYDDRVLEHLMHPIFGEFGGLGLDKRQLTFQPMDRLKETSNDSFNWGATEFQYDWFVDALKKVASQLKPGECKGLEPELRDNMRPFQMLDDEKAYLHRVCAGPVASWDYMGQVKGIQGLLGNKERAPKWVYFSGDHGTFPFGPEGGDYGVWLSLIPSGKFAGTNFHIVGRILETDLLAPIPQNEPLEKDLVTYANKRGMDLVRENNKFHLTYQNPGPENFQAWDGLSLENLRQRKVTPKSTGEMLETFTDTADTITLRVLGTPVTV